MGKQCFTIGCVQTNAREDVEKTLDDAETGILEAVARGASLVITPENVAGMLPLNTHPQAIAYPPHRHPCLTRFSHLAQQHAIWLVAGSVTIRLDDGKAHGKEGAPFVNRCYVFSPEGKAVAYYDKIHLFDANLDAHGQYNESRFYQAGHHAVLVDVDDYGAFIGKLGLTICYDVRFPRLFHTLAQGGAHIISVPAAFTRPTGEAHWETLLRARAIENGVYIVAAAQCGVHGGGRETWGHSLIISPWGDVLAQGDGTSPCVITAPFQREEITHARRRLPCHHHHRPFHLSGASENSEHRWKDEDETRAP
ncbi:MAG: carbon-nitrogen hydrolase family protein [Alphaproteobacteria bacterium GM7ARS4]|nr:carbon-nitrogen hydrolase family protein [Alphaproteobacteria bacterium GM7ARS4]